MHQVTNMLQAYKRCIIRSSLIAIIQICNLENNGTIESSVYSLFEIHHDENKQTACVL